MMLMAQIPGEVTYEKFISVFVCCCFQARKKNQAGAPVPAQSATPTGTNTIRAKGRIYLK
jgi:hypothetical protein